MSNEQQVKRRINTTKNIAKITKAMEMVAASKMKRAQNQALSARDYFQTLYDSINAIAKTIKLGKHPLLSTHKEGLAMILVIGTNKGLCGALNANLARELLTWRKQHPEGQVICVGKKAVLFVRKLDMTVYAQFTDLPEKVIFADIIPVVELISTGFINHKFCSVEILFTDFVNTLSQRVRLITMLPISQTFESSVIERVTKEQQKNKFVEYIFEPSPQEIFNQLLPFYLENTLFHIFLEAKASEYSARMVAMKNASDNASELMDELKLIYNKTRQQNVTTELLDIISATMALN